MITETKENKSKGIESYVQVSEQLNDYWNTYCWTVIVFTSVQVSEQLNDYWNTQFPAL